MRLRIELLELRSLGLGQSCCGTGSLTVVGMLTQRMLLFNNTQLDDLK